MSKVVSMEEMMPLIEEKLTSGGEVSFTPKGISMLPLLKNNKDMITLKKPVFPLKKYQIVFYKRADGDYVLHRVVKVKGDSYTMRGDNLFSNEPDVKESQIIGVASGFTRNKKKYSGAEPGYILYCRIWTNTVKIRYIMKRAKRYAGKIKRRVIAMAKWSIL